MTKRTSLLASGLLAAMLGLGACAPRYVPIAPLPEPVEPAVEIPEPEPEPVPVAQMPGTVRPIDLVDLDAFELPVHVNEHVLAYIDLFTGRLRPRFEIWLQRQGRYADLIDTRIRERGVPRELTYLALIESGYSPVAVSHANAVGLWQFIASTGRLEGLRIDDLVDERRDPVRATDAALQHLQKLYARFGSWYLAAAAYNAGAGRIERALANGVDGRRGNDSIFWQIRELLPTETRNYVPQLIAASIIGTHRDLFGFADLRTEPRLEFDTVEVPDASDFIVLAEAAGVERDAIAALNTHFHRGMTPHRETASVRLPPGTVDAFRAAYALIPPEQRLRTRTHVVAAGETLSGIAARYGTTIAALQSANGIDRPDRIAIGRRITIPPANATPAMPSAGRAAANAPATTRTVAARRAAEPTVYRVQHGDTLSSIARRHGVSTRDLKEWNSLASDVIRPGDRLEVRSR